MGLLLRDVAGHIPDYTRLAARRGEGGAYTAAFERVHHAPSCRAAHVVWLALVPLLMVGTLAQTPAGDAETLFEAARTGDRARVVSLLNSGVDVNTRSRYGVTAAGFAADKGHLEIVRLLVERGASLDVTDSFYGSRPSTSHCAAAIPTSCCTCCREVRKAPPAR